MELHFVREQSKEGKRQESIHSNNTHDPGHGMVWEGDTKKTRKHHIQGSQEVSPFPTGDHKAAKIDMTDNSQ